MYSIIFGLSYNLFRWNKEKKKKEKEAEHMIKIKKWLNDTRVDKTGIRKRFNYWFPNYHISKMENNIKKKRGGMNSFI